MNLSKNDKEKYGAEFNQHILEQYKLYVEMADRISARRMHANSFFVGINTALMAAFTVSFKSNTQQLETVWFIPLSAAIIFCFVWWRIITSYRQLNSGKFKVIHAIEQFLPIAPYDSEWIALGAGKNTKLYKPFTHVESWVPVCFAVLYILMGIYITVAH
ncbi:MAG: hypothetical protein D3910_09570 [Candidatus Electrothrix sp. ATG2]|nr:hypothetical protein [Candidatus Electrothrix sp. ATG2]